MTSTQTQPMDNTIDIRSAKPLPPMTNDPDYILRMGRVFHSTAEVMSLIDSIESHATDNYITGQIRRQEITKKSPIRSLSQPSDRPKRKKQKTNPTSQRSAPSSQRSVSSNQRSATSSLESVKAREIRAFQVIYGVHKPYKKHKQFSSDGFVTIDCHTLSVRLYSMSGKSLGNEKVFKNINECEEGKRFVIGSNEIEVAAEVSAHEFKSGRMFVDGED